MRLTPNRCHRPLGLILVAKLVFERLDPQRFQKNPAQCFIISAVAHDRA